MHSLQPHIINAQIESIRNYILLKFKSMKNQQKFKKKINTEESKDKTIDKIKNYAYFLSIYSLLISILYIFGYWSIFNLNIFEYIALSDIVKYSIKPLAISLVTLIFVLLHNTLIITSLAQSIALLSKPSSKPSSKSKIRTLVESMAPGMAIPTSLFLIAFALEGPEIKWKIVPLIASYLLCDAVLKLKFIEKLKWPPGIKYLVAYLVIFFTLFSYPRGRENAMKILEGAEFTYIMEKSTESQKSGCKDPLIYPRILAQANDQTITYNPIDKSIAINKLGYGKSLKMYSYVEPKPDGKLDKFFTDIWNDHIKSHLKW